MLKLHFKEKKIQKNSSKNVKDELLKYYSILLGGNGHQMVNNTMNILSKANNNKQFMDSLKKHRSEIEQIIHFIILRLSNNNKSSAFFLYPTMEYQINSLLYVFRNVLGEGESGVCGWVDIYLESLGHSSNLEYATISPQSPINPLVKLPTENMLFPQPSPQNLGIIMAEADGNILWADEQSCWLFERSQAKLQTLNFFDLLTTFSKMFFFDTFGEAFFKEYDMKPKVVTYDINRAFGINYKINEKYLSIYGNEDKYKVLTSRITKVILQTPLQGYIKFGVIIQTRIANYNRVVNFTTSNIEMETLGKELNMIK